MKRKLLSKTTVWKYEDRMIIHSKMSPPKDLIYFSNGSSSPFEWGNGGYVDLKAPKPHFITRFKDRVKNFFKIKEE